MGAIITFLRFFCGDIDLYYNQYYISKLSEMFQGEAI